MRQMDANFKYDKSIFEFQQKVCKLGIFGPKCKDFYFCTSAIDKLESTDYKNDNRFPKLLSKTLKLGISGSKFKNSNILH